MNIIRTIIATLSKEDKQKFVRILKRRNKRNDAKNIQLFQLLDGPGEVNNLDHILYGRPAKGAYHALCKRLHDSLIDFIAIKDFDKESTKETSALKLLVASRIFFQHNQNDIGFKTLAKAELIGVKYSLFSFLNEVYYTQILHAHLNASMNLPNVTAKFNQNKLNILEDEKLNLFYATIQNELNQSNPMVSDVIKRNLIQFDLSITKNLSYESLFKIVQICNQVAHVSRDYHAVLAFVEEACQKIETSERIENEHLYQHLQILYYLSNTYFRIKKFKASKNYLKAMNSYIRMENYKYYPIFYPQYVLVENLLLIYSGKNDKAIDNLKAFDFLKYKNRLDYILDIKLSLVVALFLKEKFREAFQIYQGFHHSDTWYTKKIGYIWVIQKNLIEILLLIELDYLDLVESRINSFRKKYRTHLIQHEESIVLEFLNLVSIYYFKNEDLQSEKFKENLTILLKKKRKAEDVFTISFYAWLKAKIDKTKLYKTCLELVSNK
jgi:hypothetical protein